MALAPSLHDKLTTALERHTDSSWEETVIELAHNRRAFCFRGHRARERALDKLQDPEVIPVSDIIEISGTYCFVA